jgi:hypothetical protein
MGECGSLHRRWEDHREVGEWAEGEAGPRACKGLQWALARVEAPHNHLADYLERRLEARKDRTAGVGPRAWARHLEDSRLSKYNSA